MSGDGDFARRWGLSGEEEAWRRRARAFAAEEVAPRAREADREARFDRALVGAMGAAGLIGVALPPEAGGGGATTLADCLVAEEVGAVDGSARGFLAVQAGLVATPLWRFGSPAQQAAWLPGLLRGERIGCYALTEPGAGSDVGAIATTVTRDGDQAVLEGEKIWITNGNVADVALVFATTEPGGGRRALECWLVPTDAEGFEASPLDGRELGHRASDHARIRLRGVRVPGESRLGGEREGWSVARAALDAGRLHVAAGAVGIHRACLEASLAHARTRRQFGRRLGDHQQVGAALADMAVALDAARLLVHHAARLGDQGLDAHAAVSAAKLFATEAALEAATRAIRLHGARGYADDLPLERHWRDVIALTIYEGTSEIQRLILARALLGPEEEGRRDEERKEEEEEKGLEGKGRARP